ncbi:MAG TPA: type II toxin-antitoxin system VapC family toxin [Candidatus Nitrosotalea sp.]|nr:type II toxin-antitoxin system VapC family toxin [Candidatus Nitrosotalea sp.]
MVIDWVAPGADPASPAMQTLGRLSREAEPVVAPELLQLECANVLAAGVRRNRWTGADADAAYGRLFALPIRLVSDWGHLPRAWELSRRYDNHAVYDMLYAAVAEAAGLELITADQVLLQRLGPLGWLRAPGP